MSYWFESFLCTSCKISAESRTLHINLVSQSGVIKKKQNEKLAPNFCSSNLCERFFLIFLPTLSYALINHSIIYVRIYNAKYWFYYSKLIFIWRSVNNVQCFSICTIWGGCHCVHFKYFKIIFIMCALNTYTGLFLTKSVHSMYYMCTHIRILKNEKNSW